MTEDRFEGAVHRVGGKAEGIAGDLLGDGDMKAKGALNEAQGAVQEMYGSLIDQAQDALADADAFIKAQPWMAVLIAGTAGAFVGHVLGRSGRRVVYVRRA